MVEKLAEQLEYTFEDYLTSHASSSTKELYLYCVSKYLDHISDQSPSKYNAQAYINKLIKQGKSPSTISTRAHAILRYFKWMGESIELDCPTIRLSDPKYLSIEQVNELIDSSYGITRTLIVVLFDTAIRVSELLNLMIEDLDTDNLIISVVRKGGKKDSVNISRMAMDELLQWKGNRTSGKLFEGLSYAKVWILLKTHGNKHGMKLTPHVLRHSRAIHMLKEGADMYVVQQHLGHVNIATTMNIYGRFKTFDLKEKIPEW